MKASREKLMAALECVLCDAPARSAAFFSGGGKKFMVVRATRRLKPDRRSRQAEIVLTIGEPNYAERVWLRKNGPRKPRIIEYKSR